MRIANLVTRLLTLGLLSAALAGGCASSGNSTGAAGQSGGGTTGAAGTTGAGGTTGSAGTTGAAGTTGTAGTTGASGTTGAAGTTGTAGTTGAAGTGAAGTSGTAGSTGAAGTAGGGRGGGAAMGGTSGGSTGTAGTGAAGTGGSGNSGLYKCPSGPFTNPNPSSLTPTRIAGVPTADATINQSGNGFSTLEGPVWIGDALYVSELSNNSIPPARIFKITEDGTVSVAIADSGSNGLAVDSKGDLVSANHKVGGIVSFALPSGTPTTLVGTYMGTRFISPNDLTIRSDGTIYFTDPSYQGPQGASSQTQTRVYRLPPGSTQATVVDASLSNPNGITLSLDETKLFVTDTTGLHEYPVSGDGTVGTGSKFAQAVVSSGDGMAIDCAGNLYVTVPNSGKVLVVSPSGTSLGTIMVNGVSAVTNAAFGGTDHKTLYITAQGSGGASSSGPGGSSQGVYKVAMPLPGMPY